MNFRNLTFFRFPAASVAGFLGPQMRDDGASFERIPSVLRQGVEQCQLAPVGPLEMWSQGFVSPYGRDSDQLVGDLREPAAKWLTVGTEQRILPAAAINDALARKLDEIERREGRKPGGRTRKRLKDEVITEMLPRAFVKPGRTDALLIEAHSIVAVDTSSRRVGEGVCSEIRRALGSFPALPLNAEIAPRSVMTSWVAGEAMPEGLTIGDECELRDPADHGGVVKVQRMELDSDEIAKHLQAGKQVTRLELCLEDRISFVLGEDMVVRKLKLLDAAVDTLESTERDDLRAELDARFALMAGEVSRLFTVLEAAFRLSKAEG